MLSISETEYKFPSKTKNSNELTEKTKNTSETKNAPIDTVTKHIKEINMQKCSILLFCMTTMFETRNKKKSLKPFYKLLSKNLRNSWTEICLPHVSEYKCLMDSLSIIDFMFVSVTERIPSFSLCRDSTKVLFVIKYLL